MKNFNLNLILTCNIYTSQGRKNAKKLFSYFSGFSLSVTSCFLAASIVRGPVVQMLDSAINWINHYPADKY